MTTINDVIKIHHDRQLQKNSIKDLEIRHLLIECWKQVIMAVGMGSIELLR